MKRRRRASAWPWAWTVVWLCATVSGAAAEVPDHGPWDALLQTHVKDGQVDYRHLLRDADLLKRYLASLEAVDPQQLGAPERLAFWINAYNAAVVDEVLQRYPIASVKEVKGFFTAPRQRIGGTALSLNELEAKGRAGGDWRIHFALVCASSSCPTLRSEAYVPQRLDAQLSEQVSGFLSNPQRGLRVDQETLWASRIFDWYREDFVPGARRGLLGHLKADALIPVLSPYLNETLRERTRTRRMALRFMNYDWTLNDQAIAHRGARHELEPTLRDRLAGALGRPGPGEPGRRQGGGEVRDHPAGRAGKP